MDKLLAPFRQSKLLNAVFSSNVFISLHYALIIYINSSFLSQFFSDTQVSSLYIIGAAINTFLLLNISRLIEKVGIYRFVAYSAVIEFLATAGICISTSRPLIAIYFLVGLVNISLLLYGFDVLIQEFASDNTRMGSIRATYLTITNATIVISPAIVAALLETGQYRYVYLVSALLLLPLYYYTRLFKDSKNPPPQHIQVRTALADYFKDRDLYNSFICQFLLQLFYAFMIVYTPIYMNKYIGFSWPEIGLIFTIMLLPFIMFEFPVGGLEDEKYGEKEFMTIGFVIMGLATLFLSFITIRSFWMWAAALFITRIGAAFVEISSDTYFFKKVPMEKSNIIGFYRITRPLSFIIGPLLATILLQFIPFQYTFIVLGSIMVLGSRYSLAIQDTK
jgi:MFS family permease